MAWPLDIYIIPVLFRRLNTFKYRTCIYFRPRRSSKYSAVKSTDDHHYPGDNMSDLTNLGLPLTDSETDSSLQTRGFDTESNETSLNVSSVDLKKGTISEDWVRIFTEKVHDEHVNY